MYRDARNGKPEDSLGVWKIDSDSLVELETLRLRDAPAKARREKEKAEREKQRREVAA